MDDDGLYVRHGFITLSSQQSESESSDSLSTGTYDFDRKFINYQKDNYNAGILTWNEHKHRYIHLMWHGEKINIKTNNLINDYNDINQYFMIEIDLIIINNLINNLIPQNVINIILKKMQLN